MSRAARFVSIADSCTAANNMAAASRIRCNAGFAGIISALGLGGLLGQ
jgi:hypothetical protein